MFELEWIASVYFVLYRFWFRLWHYCTMTVLWWKDHFGILKTCCIAIPFSYSPYWTCTCMLPLELNIYFFYFFHFRYSAVSEWTRLKWVGGNWIQLFNEISSLSVWRLMAWKTSKSCTIHWLGIDKTQIAAFMKSLKRNEMLLNKSPAINTCK